MLDLIILFRHALIYLTLLPLQLRYLIRKVQVMQVHLSFYLPELTLYLL